MAERPTGRAAYQGKVTYVVETIDLDDVSLTDMAQIVSDKLNALAQDGVRNIQVMPVNAAYTMVGETLSERDYHYRERGLLVIGERRG